MDAEAEFRAHNWQHPTADTLEFAYMHGAFPMHDARLHISGCYTPDPRAILPLDAFHVPKSLARIVRGERFDLRIDTAFDDVLAGCADASRDGTWIDDRLIRAYTELHRRGHAHSIEAWRDGRLVGGLYGVRLGAAFFGESMFSRPRQGGSNASKVCLVHLVDILRQGGFRLLDTQFRNPHLDQFGCIEIPRARYLNMLHDALDEPAAWPDGI